MTGHIHIQSLDFGTTKALSVHFSIEFLLSLKCTLYPGESELNSSNLTIVYELLP